MTPKGQKTKPAITPARAGAALVTLLATGLWLGLESDPTKGLPASPGDARAPRAADPPAELLAETGSTPIRVVGSRLAAPTDERSSSPVEGLPEVPLTGSCVAPDGAPVAGARIAFIPSARASVPQVISEAVSDSEGRFALSGLDPAATYYLAAIAEGYPRASRQVQPGEHALVEFQDEAALAGVVVDADTGRPLEGAQVWVPFESYAWSPPAQLWLLEQRPAELQLTDSDGSFRLPGLEAEARVTLFVEHEGYARASASTRVTSPAEPIRVALDRGTPTEFEVVDHETGLAIRGAEVARWPSPGGLQGLRRTDSAGRFRWTLNAQDEGGESVRITAQDYCQVQVSLTRAAASGPLPRIELVRGASLVGTVYSENGARLPHASVRTSGHGRPSTVQDLPGFQQFVSLGYRSAQADARGEFRIEGLAPSEEPYRLSGSHPLYRTEESSSVVLAHPGESVQSDVWLVEAGIIEGRVTLDGASLQVQYRAKGPGGLRSGRTGPNGAYRIGSLDPGAWSVVFGGRSGHRLEDIEPRTVEAGRALRWDAELAPDGLGAITGNVRFENAEPIVGAEVLATKFPARGLSRLFATTDARGEFRLQTPIEPDARWSITCRVGEARASIHRVQAHADDVELRIPNLGRVGLRVVEHLSGATLELQHLEWRRTGKAKWIGAKAIDRGVDVHWVEVPLGLVDFRVESKTGQHLEGLLSNVLVTPDSNQVWDIELPRGIDLALSFESEEGDLGCHLNGPPFLVELPLSRYSVVYDGSGRVIYTPLEPGTYTLDGEGAFAYTPAAITLTGSGRQELTVTWRIVNQQAFDDLAATRAFLDAIPPGLMGPGDY